MSDDSPLEEEPDSYPSGLSVAIADQQSMLSIDHDRLQQIVLRILQDAGFSGGEISLAIVDDPTIHELNRNYLNHDYPTDVLSFPLEIELDRLEGEVIVSAETAIREAAEIDWSPETELLLYVIHGVLHLVGHDDHDPVGRPKMRAAEKEYLLIAGVAADSIESRLPAEEEVDVEEEQEPNR